MMILLKLCDVVFAGGVSGVPMLPPLDGSGGPKFDGGAGGLYTPRGYRGVPPSYPIGPPLGLTGFEGSRAREEERIAVPIPLCVLIMVAYISGGAVLFSLWEDWGFLEGAYFCFVTLSTIGMSHPHHILCCYSECVTREEQTPSSFRGYIVKYQLYPE